MRHRECKCGTKIQLAALQLGKKLKSQEKQADGLEVAIENMGEKGRGSE